MRIAAVYRPGQKGTRKLVAQYGERLVCVRYRYDPVRCKRYKTIELIIEAAPWRLDPLPELSAPPLPPPRRVGIRVAYNERELRDQIKAVGGTWSKEEKLWRVPSDQIKALGLEGRIVRR
jgi:hypothetical protein